MYLNTDIYIYMYINIDSGQPNVSPTIWGWLQPPIYGQNWPLLNLRKLHPPHYDGVTSIAVAAKHGKFYSGSRGPSPFRSSF